MTLTYDQPVEVTKAEHDHMMIRCSTLLAGRHDESTDKYYIKAWLEIDYCNEVLNAFRAYKK